MNAARPTHVERPPASIDAMIDRLRAHYGAPERRPPQPAIDELIQTILSQHTSDINTDRAFAALRRRFANWDDVIAAPVEAVADSIRSGGLADQKAPRIQQALRDVKARAGSYDLRFLGEMPISEARDWLTSLHGVGPKTASCVLLFSLGRDAMPVDTHVHRVALRLGLIPARTQADDAHELLESQLPPGLAYEAHLLMIRHGRETCRARFPRCAECPLVDACPSAATFLGGLANRATDSAIDRRMAPNQGGASK